MAKAKPKFETKAIRRENGKFFDLYLMNVPVFFASVHEPKLKYESTDKEYAVTAFVDDETREMLEDEFMLNKTLYKVGKDKNKKRKIKYPLEKQLPEDSKGIGYDEVEGLNGVQLTLAEFNKKGNANVLTVITEEDGELIPFDEDIGNMSICTIKLFGYINKDDALVVQLNTVRVDEHVPYEGGIQNGEVTDDILGGTYKLGEKSGKQKDDADKADNSQSDAFDDDDFDDDVPF